MPQLSLYLDDFAMEKLRADAARSRQSLSSYARDVLNSSRPAWPDSFWRTYGALKDDSFVVPAEEDEAYDRPSPCFD